MADEKRDDTASQDKQEYAEDDWLEAQDLEVDADAEDVKGGTPTYRTGGTAYES